MSKTLIMQVKNRQDFLNSLDMGLIANQLRIQAGTYEVTIKRLSKQELKEQADLEAIIAAEEVTRG